MSIMKRTAALFFINVIRPLLPKRNEKNKGIMDCPCCGQLLEHYDDYGWLHLADGDADCYGALGYGKGKKLSGFINVSE